MSDGEKNKDTRRRVKKAKEIFEKYGDEIRAIIEFNIQDKHTTEDIFQDFFVSVVENPIPQEVEDIRGYIYRAIVNDAIDRIRRARIRREGDKKYAESVRDNAVQKEPQHVLIIAEEVERVFLLMEERLPRRHIRAIAQHYGVRRTARTDDKLKVEERSFARYVSEAVKKMRCLVLQREGVPG